MAVDRTVTHTYLSKWLLDIHYAFRSKPLNYSPFICSHAAAGISTISSNTAALPQRA
jgi:hypothetical protein